MVKRVIWPSLAIALSASITLFGYEFARSASSTLFREAYGAENMPWTGLVLPWVLLGWLRFYDGSLRRLGAPHALSLTYALSALVLALGYVAKILHVTPYAFLLVCLRQTYIVLLIEQYWSMINSIVREGEARVLNGWICGLSSIGAIFGGYLVRPCVEAVGTDASLWIPVAGMLPAWVLSHWAARQVPEPASNVSSSDRSFLALSGMRGNRFLIALFGIIVSTQVFSGALEFLLQIYIGSDIPTRDEQTSYQGTLYGHINALSAFLQFVGAPLLLRLVSSHTIQILVPLVHAPFLAFAFLNPSLSSVALALLTFKAVDYSVFRASKEILYIPMTRDVRYRIKAFIDVFGYRGGQVMGSGALLVAKAILSPISAAYLTTALGAMIVWLTWALRLQVDRRHHPGAQAGPSS